MIKEARLAKTQTGGNSPLKAWTRALAMTAPITRNRFVTLPEVVQSRASEFGGSPALLSEGTCLTYAALSEQSNRYARWALAQGLDVGDVVCLLMPNCPEYMAIWLGITRVGAVVALVNNNLARDALAYSVNRVQPKQVIVAAEFADAIDAVRPVLPAGIGIWVHGEGNHRLPRIDREVERGPYHSLEKSAYRAPVIDDLALYIYTSGTTGLPKAAKVSHFRIMQWCYWFAGMMDIASGDRMYNCLPMYHSIGGVVATGAPLVAGASVFIRQRFSASRFWEDVIERDCTIFQYIGELCRYLMHSPPHPRERDHRIRLCCGNGLRGDVWNPFKQRFRIPQILEFYAATEGSFSLYNCEGRAGAIGRIPSFFAHRFPVALISVDAETGAPIRNGDGFCIRCSTNEVGEAIGQIPDGRSPGGRFEGYADPEASEKKVLRDVFIKGDAWYRTGDLMTRDESGYFYFVDRLGDTFRWKGENVSTAEVGETISACPGVIGTVVYGVAVPGTEGRAGMAAVVVGGDFDLSALHHHIGEHVPEYARPLFLRICSEINTTATFKPKKQELARQGYDPAVVVDPIYFNDRDHRAFVMLDAALYRRIQSGNVCL